MRAAPEWSRHATVVGIRMRWEEHGVGVPVVFVHGIPTSPRLWRYVIPRLGTVRALAWELVGYGRSIEQGRGRNLSVRAQAGYLRAWLHSQGIERAVFVAHDLGGGIVQRLAVLHPELCAGIVLTDVVAYDNWPLPRVQAVRPFRGVLPFVPNALVRSSLGAMLFGPGHDDTARAREALDVHWSPYAATNAGRALARQLAHLDNRDTREIAHRLPELRVPTRVIWAEGDLLPVESGRRLARDLGAELTVVPGAHFLPEDHPEVVVDAVNDVVRRAFPIDGPEPPRPRPV